LALGLFLARLQHAGHRAIFLGHILYDDPNRSQGTWGNFATASVMAMVNFRFFSAVLPSLR